MLGVSIRERLGVPCDFRAVSSNEEMLRAIRYSGSKTRLKVPVPSGNPTFDPFKEPTRWKKELEERGIKSEIRVPRRKDENPVLVYNIH